MPGCGSSQTREPHLPRRAGLARTMRELAAHVPTDRHDLLDTSGTGGGRSTFNVSTTAALIAAMRAFVASKFGEEVDDAQPQSAG